MVRSLPATLLTLLLPLTAVAQDDSDAWAVEHPPTPYEAVRFTVSEGAWMNVDVSPDGEEIAFDLLATSTCCR